MATKYCKVFIAMVFLFLGVSVANSDMFFFLVYPCMLAGIIPVTLLGYDERNKWLEYSGTLPYTKAQIVSSKYLVGLIAQVSVLILTMIAQAISMHVNNRIDMKSLLILLVTLVAMSCFSSSITLPFMFKWGVEKGRIAYYFMIGFICGGALFISNLFEDQLNPVIQLNSLLFIVCAIAIGIYALSWYLSIRFFEKREMR
ncbi:MAG: ABC-2 transporter permease [Ruminococcus sp.]|nr:ABC-2 transporter permease [Ruminococcus sp.]